MPIPTAQERLGTRIAGRYVVERVLATGGMSVLFEARDVRARRAVALKVLKAEDCDDSRRVARFLQEMRLTAELRHPHVVDVLDLGEDEAGIPFLVMELLHGRSLQAELDARGTLGLEEALATLLPVMLALGAVHEAGVVHRDIKPDNIFLHDDPRFGIVPKLLDFGIAKQSGPGLATRTGAVLGTPDYMAPEQLVGGVVGPAVDVWAVGAVLYRALSGQTPFQAASSAEVIAKLTRERAPTLRVDGLPPPVCAAIDRALAREPADRYRDMDAFTGALVLCAREAGFAIPEEPPPRPAATASSVPYARTLSAASRSLELLRPKSRTPWMIAAVAGLVLIAAAAVQSRPSQSVSPSDPKVLADAPAPSGVAPQAIALRPIEAPAAEAARGPAPPQPAEVEPRARPKRAAKRAQASKAVAPGPAPERTGFTARNADELPIAVDW